MKQFLILLCAATLLTGCVTGPWYKNTKKPNAAVLRWCYPNLFQYLAGNSIVILRKVDGLNSNTKEVNLDAGRHCIAVDLISVGTTYGHEEFYLMFKGNHKYTFSARFNGNYFTVNFIDITGDQPQIIESFTGCNKVTTDTAPTYIPVAH